MKGTNFGEFEAAKSTKGAMKRPALREYDKISARLEILERSVFEMHLDIAKRHNKIQGGVSFWSVIAGVSVIGSLFLLGIGIFNALTVHELRAKGLNASYTLRNIESAVNDIRTLRLNSASKKEVAEIVEQRTANLFYTLRKELDRQNLCEAELYLVEYYEEAYNECNNKFAQPAIAIHQEPGTCPEREWS